MMRIAILLLVSFGILFSVVVVWPPDLVGDSRHVLGTLDLPDGNSFTVTHYWNHSDFYTTRLEHRSSDGSLKSYTLDGDDHKQWFARIVVDPQKRIVTVDGYTNVVAPY